MSDKDQLKKLVAERLRALRESRGLQQIEVDAALHIRPNNVSNWETCVSLIPTYRLKQACDFFDVSADYILGRSPLILSPREHLMLDLFRQTDDHDQETLIATADALRRRHL